MYRILLGVIFFACLIPYSLASTTIPGEGLQAEGNQEWQKAISIYLDALLITPNNIELWLRVASIEHQLKHYALAIDAYKHASRLQPSNPVFHKTMSEVFAEMNQPGDALIEINEAVMLKPNDITYLAARAKIANWNHKLEIALDSNQRILGLNKNENQLDLLTEIGSLQQQLHHYPEAIEAYQQAILTDPKNAALYQHLSEIYAANKEPEKALVEMDKALSLDPNNVLYLNAKANFETWLSHYPIALETYKKTLQLSPNNNQAIKGVSLVEHLIKVSQKTGDQKPLSPFDQLINQANNNATLHLYDDAAIVMKKAIALKPKDPTLYKKLSEIYASAKQAKLALAAINKAVLLAPQNIDYWRARGKLASWSADKAAMRDSYERILRLKPHDEEAMLYLAHAMAWQAKTDESIHAYQQFLSLYPQVAEGWIKYAEVLSWTGSYLAAFDALNHYCQLKGTTRQYLETRARILALAGRFKSALAINDALLQVTPNNPYALSTEVTALTTANQTNKAIFYLKKLNNISPNDPIVKGLNDITFTPLRSNINLEGDYTEASDTTRIEDIPVGVQYFLTPTTSLLLQGLYEHASAATGSGLVAANGNRTISDESAKIGITTQIDSLNLRGSVGSLHIQNGNNHGIYDATLNTNVGETAQLTIGAIHNLYRPYLVPQSPRSISLQVMESRIGALLQWQPFVQKYLNVVMSYSDLSYNNNYTHFNVWPKTRIYGSEHWLVTVGADGDFWHYKRRATDGYYSPLHFDGYEGTVELYYAQSENIGYGFSGGFGIQKDETFPHYFYEEDLAGQIFLGIFTDWELQLKSGYTLRENPTGNYHCWSSAIVLTRRF